MKTEKDKSVSKIERLLKMHDDALKAVQEGKGQSGDAYVIKKLILKNLEDVGGWGEDTVKSLPLRDILHLVGADTYAKLKLPQLEHQEQLLENPDAPESMFGTQIKNEQHSVLDPISKRRRVLSANTVERLFGKDIIGGIKNYNVDIHDPDYAEKNNAAWSEFRKDYNVDDYVKNYADKAANVMLEQRKKSFNSDEEKQEWLKEKSLEAQVKMLTSLKDAFDTGKFDIKKSDQYKEVTKSNAKLNAAHAYEEGLQEMGMLDFAHLTPIERKKLFNKIMSGYDQWAGHNAASEYASLSPAEQDKWIKEHAQDPDFREFLNKYKVVDSEYNKLLAKYGIKSEDIAKLAHSVLHSNMAAQDWVDYLMLNPEEKLRVAPSKVNQDKYTLNVQQGNDQVVQLKGPKEISEFFKALNFVKGLYNKDDFKTLNIDPETLTADIGDVNPEFKDLVSQYTPEDLEGRSSPDFIDVFMPRGGNADEERYARFMHAMSEGDPSYFFGDNLKDLPKEYAKAKEKMLDAFISTGKLPDDIWDDKKAGEEYTSAQDRALRKYGSAREAFNLFQGKLKDIDDEIKAYPEHLQAARRANKAEQRSKIVHSMFTSFKDARDAMRELKGLVEPEKHTGLQRVIKALGLSGRLVDFFEKKPDLLRQYASGKRKLQDWLSSRITPDELASLVRKHLSDLPAAQRKEAGDIIKPYLSDLMDNNTGRTQDRIASFMRNVVEDASVSDSPLKGFADVFTDEMYNQADIKNIRDLIQRKDIMDTLGLTDMEDRLLNTVHNSQKVSDTKVLGLANEEAKKQREEQEETDTLKKFTDSTNKKDIDEKNIYKRKVEQRRQDAERKEEKEKEREVKKYLEDAKQNEQKNAKEAWEQQAQREEEAMSAGAGWIPDLYSDTGIEPGSVEEAEWKENYPEASKPVGERTASKPSESEQAPLDKGVVLSPEMKEASDKFNSMSPAERANELVKNNKIRRDTVLEAKDKGDAGGKLFTKKKATDEKYSIDLSPIAKVLDDLGGF